MQNAKWITGPGDVPVFFTDFSAKKPVEAVLKATACGVYEARINGKAVSGDLLRPGWTNYRKRLQVQAYDVTALLEENNRLEIAVAPGWWQAISTVRARTTIMATVWPPGRSCICASRTGRRA